MSHHHHHHSEESVKNIKLVFFLNLFFTVIEFIGGFLTNSVAIMSDALHDLGDSISLGIAWFLQKFSDKKSNAVFTYGYKRFSLLGALINGVILFAGSFIIIIESIPRIYNVEDTNAQGMILLSLLGIAVNGIAVFKMSRGKSMNERVLSWHLLEDVLGWVAVLIVSIVMLFTDLKILDPILSILITIYILYGVSKNLKETILLFLQATPKNIHLEEIIAKINTIDTVIDVHDTHLWSLDGENNVLSAHIKVRIDTGRIAIEKLKSEIKHNLSDMGISHSTLEIEYEDEDCTDACN
jgi:cobalt-zinc-cadmium efflux system protein